MRVTRAVRSGLLAVAPALLLACTDSDHSPDTEGLQTLPADSVTQYASNGAQIFYTGRSSSGDPVLVTAPSAAPDGRPTFACADCHGPDGRGLDVQTDGGMLRTPEISFAVLSYPMGYRNDVAYDEATLALTLRTGIRVDGYKLSPQMPRWKLSKSDMADLIAYLKTLRQTPGTTLR